MNDELQTRLRDALDAAARTIPDHAPAPGLPVSPPERHRPARRTLIALGAAAAVLLVVGVPIAARNLTRDTPGPALAPCPEPTPTTPVLPNRPKQDGVMDWSDGLPAGPPPTAPYTLTDTKGAGYLQDGGIRLALPSGQFVRIVERLGCDWLVLRGQDRWSGRADVGVLSPAGEFRQLGRTDDRATLSPDGAQVAYVPRDRSEVVIADVATGRQLDRLAVPAKTYVLAWNPDGIWFDRPETEGDASVWKPGAEPREVRHDGHDFHMYRSTDRMVVQPSSSTSDRCVRVVTLESDGRLTEVMRRCGQDREAILSPDGNLLLTGDGKAYRVPANTPTALSVPSDPVPQLYPNGVWEDNTHLLLEANIGGDNAGGRYVLVRCDAVTGDCERIYDDSRRLNLQLAER